MLRALRRRLEARRAEIAEELTWQMGRPIRYAPGEIAASQSARATWSVRRRGAGRPDCRGQAPASRRFIRREPVGVVFTVAPWNYPYPDRGQRRRAGADRRQRRGAEALAQTPLCAERFAEAFAARACRTAFPVSPPDPRATRSALIGDRRVDFVAFTGSVAGGRRCSARRPNVHRRRAGARRQGSGLCPRRRRTSPMRSRTSSTAPSSTPGSPAAGSSASTCTSSFYDAFVDGFVGPDREVPARRPAGVRTTLGPDGASGGGRFVRAQIDEAAAGARGPDRRTGSRAASRARRIWRRRCWSTSTTLWRHERGDLRPRGSAS